MTGYISILYPHYGFIQGDDGIRYFLYRSGLQATTRPWEQVQPGDAVDFTPIQHPKGGRAIECRVTGRAFDPGTAGFA